MAEVVALSDEWKPPAEVKQELIVMLQDLLKQAKAGEIEIFTFAAIDPGGFTHCNWWRAVGRCTAELAGAASALQHEIQVSWRA